MRASFFFFLIALIFSVLSATGQMSPPVAMAGPTAVAPTPASSENYKLREQIQGTLRNEPSLAGSRLDVEVTDSQILLSGSVTAERDKQTVLRIARSYGNNRRVVDEKVSVQSRDKGPALQSSR